MCTTDCKVPSVTAPMALGDGDVEEFGLLSAATDGPIVLAFFPAAFTGGCTEEMCTFRDSMARFEEVDATVYGVSVDLPFALNAFADEHDLNFPLVSDFEQQLVEVFDVRLDGVMGLDGLAERSVFVIDTDGVVRYEWVREDGNPDFDELISTVESEVRRLV